MFIELLIPTKEEWEPIPLYLDLELPYHEDIDEETEEEEPGSVIIIDI